jgi:hypothetical protein
MIDRPAVVTGALHVPGYVVGERIGAGGFGEVFAGRHELIGRDVAIKVLYAKYSADPEAVARFVAEAKAVGQLSHPGIVDLYDFGRLEDGRQYCVMERIRGKTLREILRERGRLPFDEALPILKGIAGAVDAAHAAGIAHRDLKPDNVFVANDGLTKLIDFGLAKLTREEAAPVTVTGSVFGTPLYMSPEQCRGKALDTRTDLYSFGVLAYQVLTGELPWTGDALELALHHLNDQPTLPSERCKDLDERVDRVLLALMAKDPAKRPSSLGAALASLVGEAELPAMPTQRMSRRPSWLGVAVLGAIGVLGVGVVAARQGCVAPEGDDCGSTQERLAGIWDRETRAAIAARFATVDREDVRGTWNHVSNNLDTYAATWSTQWHAACAAPDRKTDGLLYQQRLTCLENALLSLRGVVEGLRIVEPQLFSETFNGDFTFASLVTCTMTDALRAQRPAPAPEHRAEAIAAELDIDRLRVEARTALYSDTPIDPVLAELEQVASRVDKVAPLTAARALGWVAYYANWAAQKDPTRQAWANAKIDAAITRSEAVHDDAVLARSLDLAAMNARGDTMRGYIERGDQALERAGHPPAAEGEHLQVRAVYELRAGHEDLALAAARASLEAFAREAVTQCPPALPCTHTLGGYTVGFDVMTEVAPDEGIAASRTMIAQKDARFGSRHMSAAKSRVELAKRLVEAGRYEEAGTVVAAARAVFDWLRFTGYHARDSLRARSRGEWRGCRGAPRRACTRDGRFSGGPPACRQGRQPWPVRRDPRRDRTRSALARGAAARGTDGAWSGVRRARACRARPVDRREDDRGAARCSGDWQGHRRSRARPRAARDGRCRCGSTRAAAGIHRALGEASAHADPPARTRPRAVGLQRR